MIKFEDVNILVVGDIMLDEYIFGGVDRISPEAPVPIVWSKYEYTTLGGAGNVVNNLAALGSRVAVVGILGEDTAGFDILEKFNELGVVTEGLVFVGDRPTTTKTRIMSSNQQLIRIDREDRMPIDEITINKIVNYVEDNKGSFDALILSDYGKGVLTKELTAELISIMSGKFIAADPIGHDYSKYKGASIITPNVKEAEYAANMFIKDKEALKKAAEKLIKYTDNLLITRGKDGMALFRHDKRPYYVPTASKEVYDVSGAGDTVISTLTFAATSGFTLVESCKIANRAAGIVVGKAGTATVTVEELDKT